MGLGLLKSVLKDGVVLHEVEESIFTTLPPQDRVHPYDSKVGFYDAVIGNRFYNRMVWGNWPDDYRKFCVEGLHSSSEGKVLDVGCGSLVFTHPAYAACRDRPVVLFDRSLGMLRKAKKRLADKGGKFPAHTVLVQGDALDLPFRPGAFETVFSFGMLHIFENLERFVGELRRVKGEQGKLFATSLVGNNGFGKKYLRALQKAGEVGVVCDTAGLSRRLSAIDKNVNVSHKGNMAYVIFGGN